MSRSFSPAVLKERLAALAAPRMTRDPRTAARLVLGVLVGANLLAGYFVWRPLGGSPQDLDAQAAALRVELRQHHGVFNRLQSLKNKTDKALVEGNTFLANYFMDRRTASSTIVNELSRMAKDSGIRPRDHTFSYDPIEGSETLTLMSIHGNYEGTYADLMHYINRLDRTSRFIIIDTLSAAPQSGNTTLTVQMRLYTFVKEGGTPADAEELLRKEAKVDSSGAPAPQPVSAPSPRLSVPPVPIMVRSTPIHTPAATQAMPLPVQVAPPVPTVALQPRWQGPPDQTPDGTNPRPLRPGYPRRRMPASSTEDQ